MKPRISRLIGPNLSALWPLVRPYRSRIGLFLTSGLLATSAEAIGIALFIPFIQFLVAIEGDGSTGLLTKTLTNLLSSVGVRSQAGTALLIVTAFIFNALFLYVGAVLKSRIYCSVVKDLQASLVSRLTTVDYQFVPQLNLGLVNDTIFRRVYISGQVTEQFLNLLAAAVAAVVYTALLFSFSWQLTLLVPVLGLSVALSNGGVVRVVRKMGQRNYHIEQKVARIVHNMVTGNRMIRSAGREQAEVEKAEEALIDYRDKTAQKLAFKNLALPISQMIFVIAICAIILIGSKLLGPGAFPSLAVFGMALMRLTPKLSSINVARSYIAAEMYNVEDVLALESRLKISSVTSGQKRLAELEGPISFNKVNFSYSERVGFQLSDLDFQIPFGKTTALVGPSGSGKSTLLDLLLRFYDSQSGQILVGNTDLRDLDLSNWRSRMGVVSQDGFIFNGTVADNIAFGKADSTPEQVERAAKLANAFDFISELPEGFETEIGERGALLSGGQRQRIAIARALVGDPEILIFDEATSQLDLAAERLIQDAVAELRQGRTIIIVAHRLSTVVDTDNILVLEGGRVVEQGNHRQLMAAKGSYWNLYRHSLPTDAELVVLTEPHTVV